MCLPGLFHAKFLRGDYFRKEFQILGEVRSLIPPHVHIMGMTATATTTTRDRVISTLGLINPVVVSASPDKPNISYAVRQKVSIEEAFSPLAVKLKTLRRKLPRMIIFCRRYEECTLLYHFFLSLLKNEFTQPVGAPNLPQFRLVDMYTSVTRKSVQESIVASFSTSNSLLRIVICTIAFGMGIDCVDVCQIIHWGPPADLESYVQECGRAGRNCQPANALLFWKKADFKSQRTACKDMKDYCTNTVMCRRAMLMAYFDSTFDHIIGCSCCDICALNCECTSCNCKSFPV